jgi:hypothetical protein
MQDVNNAYFFFKIPHFSSPRALRYLGFFCKSSLNGQYHEFFSPRFFPQSNPPRPLTNGLKPFRIWLCIRQDIL